MMQPKTSGRSTEGLYNPGRLRLLYLHWIETPRLDFTLAVALAGLWWFLALRLGHVAPFGWIAYGVRHSLYQTAIATSVTLGGLTLTSISVLINLLRMPLSSLDKLISADAKRRIGFVFVDCLTGTAFVFASAIAGFTSDGSANPQGAALTANWSIPIEAVFVASMLLVSLRFTRIVGVLRLLLPVAS